MATQKDQFCQYFATQVNQENANELTFKQIESGIPVFEKMAWIIHRLEVRVDGADMDELAADGDKLQVALANNNGISSLEVVNPTVIYRFDLTTFTSGTPAERYVIPQPWTIDFTSLPGGGLLAIPNPFYVALDTTGFEEAVSALVKGYYTVKKMSDSDYFELVQTRQILLGTA